jgi:hypothetical protein
LELAFWPAGFGDVGSGTALLNVKVPFVVRIFTHNRSAPCVSVAAVPSGSMATAVLLVATCMNHHAVAGDDATISSCTSASRRPLKSWKPRHARVTVLLCTGVRSITATLRPPLVSLWKINVGAT